MKNKIAENFYLYICGKSERRKYKHDVLTHFLAIEDIGERHHIPWGFKGIYTQIQCYDDETMGGNGAPDEYDVQKMIAFIHNCMETAKMGKPVHLLISCRAGMCRSTAAGLLAILMNMRKGINFPYELAIEKLLIIRNCAYPNNLIIHYGEKLLGFNGLFDHLEGWRKSVKYGKIILSPAWDS